LTLYRVALQKTAERKKRAKEVAGEAEDSNSNALIDLSASIITISTKKARKSSIIGLKKSTKSFIPSKRSKTYNNNNNNNDEDNKDIMSYKGMRIKYKLGASTSTSRTKLKKVTFTPLVPMPIKLLTLII
jgi:hypothetical protein